MVSAFLIENVPREEVAEMLAEGIMVDIPYSCEDFDPDEWHD